MISMTHDPSRPDRATTLQRIVYGLFTVGVSVGIFIYLFTFVSPAAVAETVRNISWYYIGFFFLFSIIMSIGRTWRYLLVLRISGYRPNVAAMYLVTLVRNFFSDLLPARLGTLVYIYLITNRLGVPFAAATSSYAFAFLFDIISLAPLLIITVSMVTSGFFSKPVVIAASVFLLAVCIVVLVYLPAFFSWLAAWLDRLHPVGEKRSRRWAKAIESAGDEIRKAQKARVYFRVLALSLLVRAGKYLSLYALLLAIVFPMGHDSAHFPFPKVFLGLCAAELAASLPISGIAGFGVYEGAWAMVFQILGYDRDLSILTSISHHLISQLYGYGLGAVALGLLLLPIFGKRSGKLEFPRQSRQVFWVGFAAVSAMTVVVTWMLLIPIAPVAASTSEKSALAVDRPTNAAAAFSGREWKTAFPLKVGRIVYERPDGIYLQRVGDTGSAEKIVPDGRYPRWSPDGKRVVFIKGSAVGLFSVSDRRLVTLAEMDAPRAVAFHPSGDAVWVIDRDRIRSVDRHSREVTSILRGRDFRELAVAGDPPVLAVTVKAGFGYRVETLKEPAETPVPTPIAKGCSASLAPSGDRVTVNGDGHFKLDIHDARTGTWLHALKAPAGETFDNHFWSNDADWIASITDKDRKEVLIQQVSTGQCWKVTDWGDCDRPDLFLSARKQDG